MLIYLWEIHPFCHCVPPKVSWTELTCPEVSPVKLISTKTRGGDICIHYATKPWSMLVLTMLMGRSTGTDVKESGVKGRDAT